MNNPAIISYIARHEQVLYDLIKSAEIPAARLKEAILYSLFPGGKRLRPVLVYLSGELLDTNQNALDIIAASIELIHSFSLVHDDLPAMDDDDFRRDKPSCHKAFDEATAILVGDGIQALAIDILLTELPKYLPMDQVVAVTHELLHACGPAGMVSGQSLDMTELTNPDIDEESLSKIHSLKTGKLIIGCIKMAIKASQASPAAIKSLNDFAESLGLLFQMQDDYLDKYDESNTLGKCRSSDQANHKMTFANIYSKERLSSIIKNHIAKSQQSLEIFGDKAKNLQDLLSFLSARTY
ncbi:MAG: polyprenyl synthetase family protein [Legionellaceae bacterium]|nr:polyprenyl synthetase family protein [Legionellaceae bacterium]